MKKKKKAKYCERLKAVCKAVRSLPCSQAPATGLYPEPNESIPYPIPISVLIRLNMIHLPLGLRNGFFPSHSVTKPQLHRQEHTNAPRFILLASS
jgi:hypothetical protein